MIAEIEQTILLVFLEIKTPEEPEKEVRNDFVEESYSMYIDQAI